MSRWAASHNYTLYAERAKPGIGYSYTLWERGAKHPRVLSGLGSHSDPRFVRLARARWRCRLTNEGNRAGVAQSVERQPSKLNVAGSRPVSRSISHFVLGTTLSLFGRGWRGGCVGLPQRSAGPAA